jgi:hypothetical protein
MDFSRRMLLKWGGIVALLRRSLSNIVPAALAAQRSGKDDSRGRGGDPDALASERLARYTKSTFAAHLNSIFRINSQFGIIALTLEQVQDGVPVGAPMSAKSGNENFVLIFRGTSPALPQDTYLLEHNTLGTFPLFLVPGGTNTPGRQTFVAVINRMDVAYSGVPRGRK